MDHLQAHFDRFLKERVYLHNITPKTREYYLTAWKAFLRAHANAPPRAADAPILTRADLQHFIIHLRERGIGAVTCNCWLRGLNAFGRWLHIEGKIREPVRLCPQKEEKRRLPLHGEAVLRVLIGYGPRRSFNGGFMLLPARSSMPGAGSKNC
jgi:hypothetical protein